MNIIISERQCGKTTKLVKQSAETGAIIVVPNHAMGTHVEMVAYELGLKTKIPTPITVTEYIRRLAFGGMGKTQKYLVDELQMMLEAMNVEEATVDIDSAYLLQYHSINARQIGRSVER